MEQIEVWKSHYACLRMQLINRENEYNLTTSDIKLATCSVACKGGAGGRNENVTSVPCMKC